MSGIAESTDVSRILFGFAAGFHYLFVPLTIGLMAVIAALDAAAWWTRKSVWEQAGMFWGRLFVLNFICGIVTGWPLRYHIKEQWPRYAHVVGEIFEYVFAIEGRIAPWLFGLVIVFAIRRHLPLLARFAVSSVLAVVLIGQSFAILALNAWMQRPAGVEVIDGRFRLVDPSAIFSNPLLMAKVLHTVGAAYVLGGMFVVSISAWLLLNARKRTMATSSLRVAAGFTGFALVITGLAGHWSGELLARYQPAKFAAIEALWQPRPSPAALTLMAIPDAATRSNLHAIEVPGVLGWVAGDSKHRLLSINEIVQTTEQKLRHALTLRQSGVPLSGVMSLEQYQRDVGPLGLLPRDSGIIGARFTNAEITAAAQRVVPPVAPLFWGFRVMLGAWGALMGVMVLLTWFGPKGESAKGRLVLWACVLALPLPWIATEAGWMICELGRQPWTVTGALSTAHSGSDIPAAMSALALLGWGCVYAVLMFANVMLTLHWIRGSGTRVAVQEKTVRSYSVEEKWHMVRKAQRAQQRGTDLEAIARQFRVSASRLRRWMKQMEEMLAPGPDSGPQTQMEFGELLHDLSRLRARNAESVESNRTRGTTQWREMAT